MDPVWRSDRIWEVFEVELHNLCNLKGGYPGDKFLRINSNMNNMRERPQDVWPLGPAQCVCEAETQHRTPTRTHTQASHMQAGRPAGGRQAGSSLAVAEM